MVDPATGPLMITSEFDRRIVGMITAVFDHKSPVITINPTTGLPATRQIQPQGYRRSRRDPTTDANSDRAKLSQVGAWEGKGSLHPGPGGVATCQYLRSSKSNKALGGKYFSGFSDTRICQSSAHLELIGCDLRRVKSGKSSLINTAILAENTLFPGSGEIDHADNLTTGGYRVLLSLYKAKKTYAIRHSRR